MVEWDSSRQKSVGRRFVVKSWSVWAALSVAIKYVNDLRAAGTSNGPNGKSRLGLLVTDVELVNFNTGDFVFERIGPPLLFKPLAEDVEADLLDLGIAWA